MKEIILYTKDGVRKQVLPVTAGSKIRYAMGKEDSLTLRFSVDTPVSFKLGDHVQLLSDIPHSGIYEITELPTPTYDNSTGGYKYEARFDAHYCKWKNKIFKYTPENASSEASWSLTAPLHTHLEVFLRNLKSLGYKYKNQDYIYIIDSTVENKSIAMEYANENMLDALYRMASETAWNCDVWVSGNEIHFGHCESGNATPLRRGIEVTSSQRSESKGVYATRLYAFGGERNIPRSYGKRFIDSVLTNGLTHFTGVLHNTNYYLDYDEEVDIHFLSGVDKGKTFHVVWRYGNFHPRGEEQIKAQKGDKFEILNFPEEVPDRYLSYGVDGLTINGVVQKRLMMPRSIPYIDVYPDMTTEEAIEAVVVFDDIYPKRVGTLANVEPVQRDVKDGDKVVDKFTAYQYTDEGLNFKEEYILEGEELKITFQKGKLSGMTFGVQFDPGNKKEQKWEIIRNEDYGRPLPDETLKPEDGDEYVLSGFNIKLVSDAYIPTAEKELEAKARQYAEKIKNDDGTFTITMNPVWVHDNNKYFACGQKVTFTDDAMFSGSRDLRVLGYEINLDIPYDSPTYTIGQSMPFSRLGNIETQLEAVTFKGSTYVSGGGGGNGSNVYIVKRDDATEPSDFNVFSSLRSLKTLLRKDKDDTTEFLLTLLKGAVFGNNKASIDSSGAARLLSAIIGNGKATIDESGIASLVSAIIGNGNARINADGASTFKSATVREGVTSDNFSTGALGSGFALKKDENNDSYLEVDRMMVRKVAIFIELLIQRLRHVGGQIILSPASITCERVEDRADAYRCYFRSTDGNKTVTNEFVVGDQARCQTFNIKPGVHQGVQNQYYWRLVTAVGDDYIDLSKTDCDRGSTVPQAGDDIVQLGNRSDATRQCAIVLAAHGAGAPYLKMYRGINSYVMDGREIIILSRDEVSIIANKLQFSTGVNVETAVNTAQNTANSASGKADKAQGAADKAQGAADSASEKAENAQSTANAASGKADKVGNDLSVFVSETNGKFEANDEKFASNLRESKYYTDQQVGKIPYSGRNLLQMWSIVPGWLSSNDGSPLPSGGTADDFDQMYDYIPVQPNEQLTLSLQGNLDGDIAAGILGRFWIYNSDKASIKQEIPEGIWWRTPQSATFTMPSDAAFVRCSLIRGNWKGLWKLERGTKVTDWTPAPEDTAALIEQNASEIKQLPDSITFSVSKKITGGALNYVSGTQGVIEVIGSGGPNETFARYTIHKEASGKTVGGAWKVRFEGCEFGANAQCTIKVMGNEWWWADFNVCYPTENKEYYIFKQHTDLPEVQNDAPVQIQLDNIKGKVYVYEFRVFETATDEKGNYPISPLPWYPSRWDTGLLDSRITQTANDITLEVENRKSEDATLSTRIQQTAEQISLKVERQIGGENLLYNSSFASDLVGWGIEGGSANMTAQIVNRDKTVDWLQGFPCLELWFNTANKGIYRYLPPGIEGEGDAFTVSFDMLKRNPWPYQLIIGVEDSPQKYVDISNHPINEWRRVTVTQYVSRVGSQAILVYGGEGDGGVVYIKNMKVERGSVATSWCPAPSEQHDKLLATGIDIMNERIVLTANNTVIQSNSGQQIAMFTEKNGKPLLRAENIDTDNLSADSLSSYNSDTETSVRVNYKNFGFLMEKTFDNYVKKADYKVSIESQKNQSEEYYYPNIKTGGIAFDYPTTTVVENEQAFHGITFNKFPYTTPDTIRNKSHIGPEYIAFGQYRGDRFKSAIRISGSGVDIVKRNDKTYVPKTEAVDIGGRKLFFVSGVYVGSGQDWSDVTSSFVKDDAFFKESINILQQ